MYLFLETISELLDRFSWVIVPSVIGGLLVVFLLWGRVPKLPVPKISARTGFKILFIAYCIIGFGSIFICDYLKINWYYIFIPTAICYGLASVLLAIRDR